MNNSSFLFFPNKPLHTGLTYYVITTIFTLYNMSLFTFNKPLPSQNWLLLVLKKRQL